MGRNENGTNLLGDTIFIAEQNSKSSQPPLKIKTSQRIGIRKGNGDEKKLRFFIAGNPFVTRKFL